MPFGNIRKIVNIVMDDYPSIALHFLLNYLSAFDLVNGLKVIKVTHWMFSFLSKHITNILSTLPLNLP